MRALAALLLLPMLLTGCQPAPEARHGFERLGSVEALRAHSEEFRREIVPVTEGVWVAVGYGLANSILIEGDDGLIVIDTMETLAEGHEVAEAFRALSDKPLKAIIYTHNHADHVFGAEAYVEVLGRPGVPVEVYAHETTAGYVHRVVSEYRPIITARAFRMFGTALDDEALVNDGIGPRLSITADSGFGFVEPTVTLSDRLAVTVAGLALELVHAPGETHDQIFVWLPERGVLAPGDNLYRTFPNLYTIRGTPYRSPKQWADSIDRMRKLPVQHLVPSHTRPVHGAGPIRQVLTDYRDAIRYVHDQTVRWINAGLTPDEIVERVQLPPHLAGSPFLAEFYGTVRWSARSVFAGNLGWFDGNPSTLDPVPPRERAQRMAELAGGADALRERFRGALQAGQWQWALELSDHLLRLQPSDREVVDGRVRALTALGEAASNPNARHYYLMSALELRDGLRLRPVNAGSDDMIRTLPMRSVLESLAVNLRAEETFDTVQRVALSFTDTGEDWTVIVRRGVVELVPALVDGPDIHARVDSLLFKKVLAQQVNAAVALARDFEFEAGGAVGLAKFLLLFRPPREAPEPAPFAAFGLDD